MEQNLMYFVIRPNDERPLSIEEVGESKTLLEIVNTLGITTSKGESFKRFSSMLKALEKHGFPVIDLPHISAKKLDHLELKITPVESNAIVSSYKTDELNRSVDPSNKNISRYSKQDFTTQPRKICPCHFNDDYRNDSTHEAPKCYMILEPNSNPTEEKYISRGSKCRNTMSSLEYYQLKTYYTSAIIGHYWNIINVPTMVFKRGDFNKARDSKLNLRIGNGESFQSDFYSNNKDFRDTVDGICKDCNSQGFQCVTKQKKNGNKEVLGNMLVETLNYHGWDSETYDMVGLGQSWNQPKYLQKLSTGEIRSVDDWNMPNFRCRPTWRFTIAKFICRNDALSSEPQVRYGWVKYIPTDAMNKALDSINNVSSEMPLFEEVDNGYY